MADRMRSMTERNVKLGDVLVKKGWLTHDQLEEALQKQKSSREFLGAVLLRERYITEDQLVLALSEQFGIPCVRLKNFYVDWTLAMKFSASLILEHQCFPLRKDPEAITFGIVNPLNASALAEVEKETKGDIAKLVLVKESEMRDLLERYRQYVNIKIRRSLDEAG